jgi:hypothetical protein
MNSATVFPIEKIDAFSTESETLSMLKASIFQAFFQHFQPNFAIFFMLFFTNCENATKSKYRQEMLNILSALKFTGSHLSFYE